MTSNNPLNCGLMVATLVALAPLVTGWQNSASAAELDCEAMAASLNPGDHYQFKLEIQSKTVRLEKGDDFCTEPVKDWFKRQLILPPPAREEMPLPKAPSGQAQKDDAPLPISQDNAPLPIQQMRKDVLPDMGLDTDDGSAPLPIARVFVKPKPQEEIAAEQAAPAAQEGQQPVATGGPAEKAKVHVTSDPNAAAAGDGEAGQDSQVYGVAAPPPPVRDDTLVKRCDRDLVSFWSPGEHVIEGQKFWLSGVFTIDLDSDGRVDDVGFKIKAKGKIGNILNYFPATEGRVSGKTVASLKLEDERDIHRLCPGNITFARADAAEIAKQKKKFAANQVKALGAKGGKQGEAAEEAVPEEDQEPEPEKKKKKVSNVILIVAAIAMVMLLAGGIGLAMALRNIARSTKDEYEDDEYEDDYDEDDED